MPRMRNIYDVVMDENKSPLKRLPIAQRFQVMVFLSFMWTTVFCLAFGLYAYWDELMLGHVALASGVLITGLTFKVVNLRSVEEIKSVTDNPPG
ncbi:MAG: hypothetical protein O3A84_03500 [Proteobacteria bacterium]|nr:hypothetical protein [Pseudomonadota bacterium]